MQQSEQKCVLWTSSLPTVSTRRVPSRKVIFLRTIFNMATHRRISQLCLLLMIGILIFLLSNTNVSPSCLSNTNVSTSIQTRVTETINTTMIYNANGAYYKSATSQTLAQKHNVKKIKEKEETFIEKVEYQLIKGIMRSVLASHSRRLHSLAKFKTLPEGITNIANTSKVIDTTTSMDEETQRNTKPKVKQREKVRGRNDKHRQDDTHKMKSKKDLSKYHHEKNLGRDLASLPPKKILMYTTFFGRESWADLLGSRTDLHNCPTANCIFTNNASEASDADALIFHAFDFYPANVPRVRHPNQRYIWLTHESPGLFSDTSKVDSSVEAGFFNWTSTYHRASDIFLPYGGLKSIIGERDLGRPGLLNTSGVTYKSYIAALQHGDLPTGHFNQELVGNWSSFLSRPKLVSWMVSHCNTLSGRELYVKELQQYLQVDVYGACGPLACGKSHLDTHCYQKVLRPNYKFYLAFENNLCDDYITEKVWYPLHHGLVPVVYGGAQYSQFLPPHSYIDATHLKPRQLARLLTSVAASPRVYGRYHLWRQYWRVLLYPPLCELCHKLHHHHPSTLTVHPPTWWAALNNCTTLYPLHQYPRKDLRVLLYDLKKKMDNVFLPNVKNMV
nr:alpha-(1,3)-fucosyltransferase C-like isoform X1 [Cherax quadricarinatus]